MPKINQEEYQVLKGLDDKWEWIARSKSGLLLAHSHKLSKRGDSWETAYSHFLAPYFFSDEKDKMFQFIQWEDENPYNIAELIEEYEEHEFYDYVGWEYYKKGETEVKKDKEWAFIELGKLFPSHAETHDSPDYTTVVKCELLNKVYDILSQLDEPEVLSEEWIDENKKYNDVHDIGYYIPVENLQNLLVPKQELPVIPNYVAKWIEENKKKNRSLVFAIKHIYDENEIGKSPKNFIWMESDDNEELFARAWLDGYTVEEEQRYFAKIKGHENIDSDDKYWNYCITDESLDIGDKKVHADVLAEYVLSATKDDWNNLGINEHNADFVEVEELE